MHRVRFLRVLGFAALATALESRKLVYLTDVEGLYRDLGDEDSLVFGPNYIIPKPVDSRLLSRIAPAVARAAIDSGVARIALPEGYSPKL